MLLQVGIVFAIILFNFIFASQLSQASSGGGRWQNDANASGVQLNGLSVYQNETYVTGYLSASSVPVTLRLTRSGTTISQVNTTSVSSNFSAYFSQMIKGGDVIEVDLPSTPTIFINVVPLSISVDKATNIFSGTAPAGSQVQAQIYSYTFENSYSLSTTANQNGNFAVNFNSNDICIGDKASLYYYKTSQQPYTVVLRDVYVPGLRVDVQSNYANGYANPGATVNLTLKASNGIPKAAATVTASSTGSYSTQFTNPGVVDILVGDLVTVEYASTPAESVTAVDVQVMSIDAINDTVSGIAPPNSKIEVYVYNPYYSASATLMVNSDSSGSFVANFATAQASIIEGTAPESDLPDLGEDQTPEHIFPGDQPHQPTRSEQSQNMPEMLGDSHANQMASSLESENIQATNAPFDIQMGSYATATFHDTHDNEVYGPYFYAGPYISVESRSSSVLVYGQPDEPITATLRNALGVIKGTDTAEIDTQGRTYMYFSDSAGNSVAIAPYDQVTVNFGSGIQRSINVTNITYIIDRDAHRVYGTAPVNTPLRLQTSTSAFDATTDANGKFAVNISKLSGGYSFRVVYRTQQGDDLSYSQTIPQFTVSPQYQRLSGYGPLKAPVVGKVENNLGVVKDTCSTTTSSYGYYSLYFDAEIQNGDIVVVDIGPLHYEQIIVPLTIAADAVNNIVYGTAPPNAWLNIFDENWFGPYARNNYKYFSADGSGNFSAAFNEVRGGDALEVLYWQGGHGDRVSVQSQVPYVQIDQTGDWVWGYTTPNTTGTASIKNSSGIVKASGAVSASTNGSYSYEPGIDIIAGDKVSVDVGVLHQTSDVIPLNGAINQATDVVSGTSLPNVAIGLATTYWNGSRYSSLNRFANTNGSGQFNVDFSSIVDLKAGDYLNIYYIDALDTYHRATYYTTSPTITVVDYPKAVQAHAPVNVYVDIANGAHPQSLYVDWDTVSHKEDHAYTYSSDWQNGAVGQNLVAFTAPSGGRIYFNVYAYVDGQAITGANEYTVDVSNTSATALYEPVSGTTNDSTPVIIGSTAPNASVTLYSETAIVATTTSDALGYFTFQIAVPLASGTHKLHAVSTIAGVQGPASNVVQLTVNPTLMVDPIHILLTARGVTQHLRDGSGFANLGGRIWTRTGDAVEIAIPISATNVTSADLYVGGVYAATMLNSGDNLYIGTYTPPTSGAYALDLKITTASSGLSSAEQTTIINILNGLIDPDGYVYDKNLGIDNRIAGAIVTCYELTDAATNTWSVWDAALWGQVNPQIVGSDGYYAFFTLPGKYKVVVTYPGYWKYESPILEVVDEPVHHNVPLTILKQVFLPFIRR